MSLRRLLAVWHARNLEFLRDRSTPRVQFPVSARARDRFRRDIRRPAATDVQGGRRGARGSALDASLHPFLGTRYIDFVQIEAKDIESTIRKVERHQLDLLLDLRAAPQYWINEDSPKGYLVEKAAASKPQEAPRRASR
jgi:hypothetical protein